MIATSRSTDDSHDDYRPMLDAVHRQFATASGPLFTTTASGRALWDAWLAGLPEDERRQHDCHSCRSFVERYGGLVTIDARGLAHPAIFDDEGPSIYHDAFQFASQAVRRARVTGVHVSSDKVWGAPQNTDKKRGKTWHHMHVLPTSSMLHKHPLLTAGQRAAELVEDHNMLCRALSRYKVETVNQALQIAESESLYRGEKVAGRLRWLADLHERRSLARGPAWDNVVWLAVATAPAGFCHVQSSVVGTLLEDLASGKSFDEVKRSFDAKMHPLQYQRPTAPPSAGNVAQAEAIVAKLGAAGSLRRRFARIEDLTTIWEPRPTRPSEVRGGSVFGHLLENPLQPINVRAPTITWEKFARTVLEGAESMAVLAPARGHYTALVTAADPDAPPIVQWDSETRRNPVTWYVYHGGSTAAQWKVQTGAWVEVTAACHMPNMWHGKHEHHGRGAMLVMSGCRDTGDSGSCIFPEFLKSEFHAIRATIEAHSRKSKLEGMEQATACGLTVRAGSPSTNVRVRVASRGVITEYAIDRWD